MEWDIIRRTYKYRLYPDKEQADRLAWTLDRCRELYNAALEERQEAYRRCGVCVTATQQKAQLPAIKEIRPEYKEIGSQILQDVLERLDRAFSGFFRRIKVGDKPGYPRFRGRDRYDSFTYKQAGWKLEGGRLVLGGIGATKVKWSRPIDGTVKTVTIRREAEQWYVCFSCVVEMERIETPDRPAIGVDVGLEHFCTLSTGEHIANPRYLRQSADILARRQQALARKRRGSARRWDAKVLVARAHRHIRNQRRDFHYKTARTLIARAGTLAVENLNIAGMVHRPAPKQDDTGTYVPNGAAAKGGLNRSILDAGWAQFVAILTLKAAEAGVGVIAVHPSGTSQACSGCGTTVKKDLSVRQHTCACCGLSLQRDHNAALNILQRAGLTRQLTG